MSNYIRWLSDIEGEQVGLVGGKAANLGRLVQLGFPVPPGFVVTTAAYHAFMAEAKADLAGPADDAWRQHILTAPMPAAIETDIVSAYRTLGAPAVAVRSSGTAEDLVGASFAGQHDTFLDVSGSPSVMTAVRNCWASLWSPRAVEYRHQRGWNEPNLAIAVVVQAMVPAAWAGVLFTAHPVTGQRDRVVIEAVPGLGEALVSGEQSGERLVVAKASLRVLAGDSRLPAGVVQELTQLGRHIETSFGQPQDIEWAYTDGPCFILQARPMTALPDERPRQTPRRYSRLQVAGAPNALEHMPVAPYPFDYSLFFRPALERGARALSSLGLVLSAIDDVYVPIADGVVQMVPPTIRLSPRVLTLPLKLLRSLRLRPEEWLAECRRTLVAQAQRIDAEDLSALSETDLLERIERLRDLQIALLIRRFGYFPRGIFASQGLSWLLRWVVGNEASRLQADLLADIPSITTASNRELAQLAAQIRADAGLRQIFHSEPPDRIPRCLRQLGVGHGHDLVTQIDAFLDRYGFRETTMPSAALPAWRDDPGIVYGLLAALVTGEPSLAGTDRDGLERSERAMRAVERVLARGWFGLKRRLLLPRFRRLLAATRGFVAFRENSHFDLMLPFAVVRRLALELGRRLAERGTLNAAGDIFFVTIEELQQVCAPEAVPELVQRRQAARRSVAGRYTTLPADLLAQMSHPDEVRGVAASPGQATGSVRLVLSERDFATLRPGEVLVARYTNPTWTPLFQLASAVVVDAGGTASHAAIVAREYGIPAVMGAGNATTRLHTGQQVVVDGSVGRVIPLGQEANGT